MATTTNFGWDTPDDTDLVKDGAAAIRTLGSSIDTSFVDLKGGTTDQVLAKNSATDLDFKWVTSAGDIEGVTAGTGISGGGTSGTVTITNSMATAIDAKGDLVAGTGADAFSRLAVGANNTVLTADSTEATGLKWATPGANKSYSLISTTALTGAATITVSSLSGYDNFVIQIQNGAGIANSTQATFRINTDTGSNYTYAGQLNYAPAAYAPSTLDDAFSNTATSFPLASMSSGGGQTNFSAGIAILGGNSTGFKAVSINSTADRGQAPASEDQRGYNYQGVYKGSAVISSISIISGSGNFSQGNVYVYGAA